MPTSRDRLLPPALRTALTLMAWAIGSAMVDVLLRMGGWLAPVDPMHTARELAWRAGAAFIGGGLFGVLRLHFSDSPEGRAGAGGLAGAIVGALMGAGNALTGSSVPAGQLIPAGILGGLVGGVLLSAFANSVETTRESASLQA
jgi:hypothetical protein